MFAKLKQNIQNISLKSLINVFFISFFSFYLLQFSGIHKIFRYAFLLVSYILFPLILYKKKFTFKNFIFCFLILLTVYFLFDKDTRYLNITLTVFVLWHERIEDYWKTILFTNLLCLPFSIFLYNHLNGLSMHIGICLFTYLLAYPNRRLRCDILLQIIMNLFIFFYVNTGQLFIGVNLIFVLNYLLRYFKCFTKKISYIFVCTFPICAFANIYLGMSRFANELIGIAKVVPSFINDAAMDLILLIDKALNSRIILSGVSLNHFGFKFFGKTLNYHNLELNGSYFNVDSGYLQVLQGKGFIILLIILILSMVIGFYLVKEKRYQCLIIFVVIGLWSINEDVLVSPVFNLIWLYLAQAGTYIMNRRRKAYEK